jgi:PhzF family phenazine biosynthesis protein
MGTPIWVVDAFASAPFQGNPAGVVVTDAPLPEGLMRALAAEMKHSETAFACPKDGIWSLRWLTPAAEVDLCGHATLATAHVLWDTGRAAKSEPLRFSTRSGVLEARRTPDERIELDFPALSVSTPDAPVDLAPALGVPVLETWRTRFDALVVTRSERDVRDAKPDFRALAALPVRGVILTARCDDGTVDFVSRFFAPAVGVDEDPVTGSAHCALAPFWGAKLGRTVMTGAQVGPRGGLVGVENARDRVKLRGVARTILRGEVVV